MIAWSKQEVSFQRQVSPSFIPFVIDFEAHVFLKTLTFQVDKGFGYLLRYVTMAWYNIQAGEGYDILGDPLIEFYINRKSCQTSAIEPPLLTTPAAYKACDNGGSFTGAHLPALELGSHKFLNYFYPFGSTIEIHVSRGSNVNDGRGSSPAFRAYLILKGYNVPEPRARIW